MQGGRWQIDTRGGSTVFKKIPGKVDPRPIPLYREMINVQEQPENYIIFLKNLNYTGDSLARNLALQIQLRDKKLEEEERKYNHINTHLTYLQQAYAEKENEVRKLRDIVQQYKDFGNVQSQPPLGGMVYNLKI